jgi:hypothetical protein
MSLAGRVSERFAGEGVKIHPADVSVAFMGRYVLYFGAHISRCKTRMYGKLTEKYGLINKLNINGLPLTR